MSILDCVLACWSLQQTKLHIAYRTHKKILWLIKFYIELMILIIFITYEEKI